MRPNGATLFLDRATRPAPDTAGAFRRAWPTLDGLRGAHAAAGGGPGLGVVAVDPLGVVAATVAVPGSFLVLGRHTRCDVCVDRPEISLRHLVARFDVAPVPTLRVWDLRTGLPLVCEDGEPAAGLVADGLLFCSLGEVTLLFVPLDLVALASDADDAWAHLPARRHARLRPVGHRRPTDDTTITRTLPPVVFGEAAAGLPVAELSLQLPTGRIARRVTADQLDRGVLFGRYERCLLGPTDDGWLSRVHLLVVRAGAEIWAVDTASTNGTKHNGVPAPAFALPEAGTARLLLGRSCVVEWRGLLAAAVG